jgi:GTPase
VPLGTQIFEVQNSHRLNKSITVDEETLEYKCDLDEEGDRYCVAKGGLGGKGNYKRANSIQESDPGKEGQEKEYELRLKMIADVGFIGFPNAGKSTLLAAITRAFPKIAPYPFTTLRPYIGHAKFTDDFNLVFADLPGIIEGAHENKGLGH